MTHELSRNERIKEASAYLRGTLAEGLRDEITGGITEDDAQLVKFHGMYLQDDRDLRGERGST
jgi:sulfite reductase (NADPH) hemoprotein beta-component